MEDINQKKELRASNLQVWMVIGTWVFIILLLVLIIILVKNINVLKNSGVVYEMKERGLDFCQCYSSEYVFYYNTTTIVRTKLGGALTLDS